MTEQYLSSVPPQLQFTAGSDRLYAPGRYAPRAERRITMFTLLSGQALVLAGQDQIPLAAGQSLLLYGLPNYHYVAIGPDLHQVHWCESAPIPAQLPPLLCQPVPTTQRIEMLQALCVSDDGTQRQHLAMALLIELLNARQNLIEPTSHPIAAELREIVASRIRADWSVDDLADQLGLTARTLARRLAAEGAAPAIDLIWRERILQGVSLLGQTDLPIGEIASACGFKSPFHFSRRIREATGRAPGDLRVWLERCSLSERNGMVHVLRQSQRHRHAGDLPKRAF